MAIPTQPSAHAALARLHRGKHSTADLAAAKEQLVAAKLKRHILAALDDDEPLTAEHRKELAALIVGGSR